MQIAATRWISPPFDDAEMDDSFDHRSEGEPYDLRVMSPTRHFAMALDYPKKVNGVQGSPW